MKGSGGTEGGVSMFWIGFILSCLGAYLFFDSVRIATGNAGWISGRLRNSVGTASAGIIFVPFFIGVIALFYDATMKWAWWLMGLGLAVIAIEIISRIQFLMNVKTTHFLGMVVLFCAGIGLMLRSYKSALPIDDEEKGS
jgi:hypothetical protein